MRKAFAVARWEFIEKVKTKAFIISLIVTPLFMIGAFVLPTLLITKPDTEPRIIGVIDETNELGKLLSKKLEDKFKLPDGKPNYIIRHIGNRALLNLEDAKKDADNLVVKEDIEGYLIIRTTIYNDSVFEYRAQNVGNIKVTERLNRTIRDLIIEKKLKAEGLDPGVIKKLTFPIELKLVKISKTGEEEESDFKSMFFSAYIFIMAMFILIISTGQLLVRSMVEEKSNRIIEVLMSSSSANDLMVGKILGLSALGFVQIGTWALIGIAIALKFGTVIISLTSALVLLPFFILGYLFYAAIFVGVGAPLSTEQEAQQVTGYLVMILIIPLLLAMWIMQDPNSPLISILTFIPFLTPTMMAVRIPIQMPSVFEILANIIVLSLSTVAAMWAAAKIFRTTVLSYGKRPSMKELWHYLKSK
ncbi:MAG: ABC transporter permease [Bacteroidota bacterium]|nr:ABC transporter permease [Bacteroidota bacterium]